MTAFRSLNDADLAAKHDRLPYAYDDGHRSAFGGSYAGSWPKLQPRVETIPSKDPYPHADPEGQWRHSAPEGGVCHMIGGENDGHNVEYGGGAIWSPRPEFARPPVNHVLEQFRSDQTPGFEDETLDAWLLALSGDSSGYPPEYQWCFDSIHSATAPELDHARAVLARVVALRD